MTPTNGGTLITAGVGSSRIKTEPLGEVPTGAV
jgi:hypothetical protein